MKAASNKWPIVVVFVLLFFGIFFVQLYAERQLSDSPVELRKSDNPDIIIYSSYNCKYCELAKAFFRKHNLAYNEHNIESSDKSAQTFYLLGGSGTPLLIINKQIIHGFDESLIREAL